MPRCNREVEIELSDGTVVEATLKVKGLFDEDFNATDENKGAPGSWLVDSWTTEYEEELDEEQIAEFDEQIEEMVFKEKWDFENAPDAEDDDEPEE
jgi:hypothetical protein